MENWWKGEGEEGIRKNLRKENRERMGRGKGRRGRGVSWCWEGNRGCEGHGGDSRGNWRRRRRPRSTWRKQFPWGCWVDMTRNPDTERTTLAARCTVAPPLQLLQPKQHSAAWGGWGWGWGKRRCPCRNRIHNEHNQTVTKLAGEKPASQPAN